MKLETVIKVLKRYEKSLEVMRNMSMAENENNSIINHYEFDRRAFLQAIEELERSNTKS